MITAIESLSFPLTNISSYSDSYTYRVLYILKQSILTHVYSLCYIAKEVTGSSV
jgi:hypothetical protein